MALERREKNAFPEDQRDPSIIDERGGDPGYHDRHARSLGYTGPEIRETSSSWVRLSESESVLRPLTPVVTEISLRRGMADNPIFAQYQKKERDKYRMGRIGQMINFP